MKKYIFFFEKKPDGKYGRVLGSTGFLQLDARRLYLSDKERASIDRIAEQIGKEKVIYKMTFAKDFIDALEIADTKILYTLNTLYI